MFTTYFKHENRPKKSSIVDPSTLLQRLYGDKEIFEYFIRMFPESAMQNLDLLIEASSKTDKNKIMFAAHKLKGLCLNLEMSEVVEIAGKIESQTKQDNFDDLQQNVSLIKNRLKNALIELQQYKNIFLVQQEEMNLC